MESIIYEGAPPALEMRIGGGISRDNEDIRAEVDKLIAKSGGFESLMKDPGDMFGVNGGKTDSEFDIMAATE